MHQLEFSSTRATERVKIDNRKSFQHQKLGRDQIFWNLFHIISTGDWKEEKEEGEAVWQRREALTADGSHKRVALWLWRSLSLSLCMARAGEWRKMIT